MMLVTVGCTRLPWSQAVPQDGGGLDGLGSDHSRSARLPHEKLRNARLSAADMDISPLYYREYRLLAQRDGANANCATPGDVIDSFLCPSGKRDTVVWLTNRHWEG
jgi:hypothetical protein